jgi:hypothetical protein
MHFFFHPQLSPPSNKLFWAIKSDYYMNQSCYIADASSNEDDVTPRYL